MHRPALMRFALGVGVSMVILALSGCGSGTAQQEAKVRPLPEPGQTLRPGEYRPEEFEPPLYFRVGKGWSAFQQEASVDFAISTQGETRWIGVTNVEEVYKPTAKGTSTVESNAVKAPKDLVGWFQDHPYLVHFQNRLRVMSYSSAHETSDLRSYAFEAGAPRAGRRVALLRCLRPASLPDPFGQRPRRTSASDSRKSRVWLPDGAQCHPRLQREGTCCSRSRLLASQRGPRRLRRR